MLRAALVCHLDDQGLTWHRAQALTQGQRQRDHSPYVHAQRPHTLATHLLLPIGEHHMSAC